MHSLSEIVKKLEEIEHMIKDSEISEKDRELIQLILIKNMNIEAELYAKYLNGSSK